MTNEQIIFNNRLNLMNTGIIGTTGKHIILENKYGEKLFMTKAHFFTMEQTEKIYLD